MHVSSLVFLSVIVRTRIVCVSFGLFMARAFCANVAGLAEVYLALKER